MRHGQTRGQAAGPVGLGRIEEAATRLLGACVGYLRAARDHPWQAPPDEMRAVLALYAVRFHLFGTRVRREGLAGLPPMPCIRR